MKDVRMVRLNEKKRLLKQKREEFESSIKKKHDTIDLLKKNYIETI